MKLLVIGSGGREHALAKKMLADDKVTTVFCAKGNPGMKQDGIEIVDIAEDDHESLIQFAKDQAIAWTFVGPEIPLLNGIVDDFEAAGLAIFGPNKAAALIEGSKEFAKELMTTMKIPTANYATFSDFEAAKAYCIEQGAPIVIKADGLAAGKGVVVAQTEEEAIEALYEMLEEQKFGASSARVVIEEFLVGEEFSLLAFVDGENVYPMVIAQDHKRAYDCDAGPNTGGMGAYSPVPQIPDSMVVQAVEEVLHPTVQGMIQRGTPYRGILYAGLIATVEGPKVIEFNARFGDPETQVVLARLESSLVDIITALLVHETPEIKWNEQASVGVVVAAQGYPGDYVKGAVLPDFSNEETSVFYAGVVEENQTLVSQGGRVLLVEANAPTIAQAQEKVYQTLATLDTDQLFYRSDIGYKALK
ncbi:phosphoribosylamine--glycine ligase [Enterococcus aquimarinus]|nr:phosphoribosylamine--glycine ligase [Enterococcus aquimarinus]